MPPSSSWQFKRAHLNGGSDDYMRSTMILEDEQDMRPSLLDFRPSRVFRPSTVMNVQQKHQLRQEMQQYTKDHQPHHQPHNYYDDNASMASSSSPMSTTTEERDAFPLIEDVALDASNVSTPRSEATNEEIKDKEEDEDEVTWMPLPVPSDVAILELDDSDDEDEGVANDIDIVSVDQSIRGTMIVDEQGFSISRQSLMLSAATLDRSSVIKTGLLFKQGFGLMNGGWKVRYVVLTSSKLTFYREENGRRRGEIDLKQCSTKSIEIMPRDSVFDGTQATMWRFAIRGKMRRVLLCAYTEADMKSWLRCLHVAMAVQASGQGRLTDVVVPSGSFLVEKSTGLMRSSAYLG